MSVSAATWLAPDSAVPQRDALLDARVVGDRIGRLIGVGGPTTIDRCERLRVNYQIGKSLRVVHRVEAAGGHWTIAARTYRDDDRGARAFEEARAATVRCGNVHPVFYDAGLNTVFWVFPNDRKVTGLAALADGPTWLSGTLPRAWVSSRLAAYAPEKSATVALFDDAGGVVAYVKFFAGDEGERDYAIYHALDESANGNPHVRVPRALAYVPQCRALVLHAVAGRRMADPASDAEAVDDAVRLGTALAGFHGLTPIEPRPFTRFASDRLLEARRLIVRVRPDVTNLAEAFVRELITRRPERQDPPCCLHGDVHPKNAIVADGPVVLIDVDDLAIGPASADLGSFVAALMYLRRGQRITGNTYKAMARAFLSGYASVRALPPLASLRWHTAASLFVERVLRAVTRVRPLGLSCLPELLGDAHALLTKNHDDDLDPRAGD